MSKIPALSELENRFDHALTQPGPTPTPMLRRSPTRAIGLVAAVAALAVGAFAAGAAFSNDSVVAGTPLSLVDDKLAISYQQVLDDPAGVESQLASAGLDISIEMVPASASLVGTVRWSGGLSPTGDDNIVDKPPQAWIVPECSDARVCVPWWPSGGPQAGQPVGYEAGLLIPLDFDARTTIQVGRPADPDEPFTLDNRPYAAGEVLSCAPIVHATVADARDIIDGAGVEAHWLLNDTLDEGKLAEIDTDGDQDLENLDAAADLIVEDAAYASDHDVILWVRRANPTEWTAAQHAAASDEADFLRQRFQAGC